TEKACENCHDGIVYDEKTKKNLVCPQCDGDGKIVTETRKVSGKPGDSEFLNVAKAAFIECGRIEGIYPATGSVFKKTVERSTVDGEIRERVDELYIEAPYELVLRAKASLDELRARVKEDERR